MARERGYKVSPEELAKRIATLSARAPEQRAASNAKMLATKALRTPEQVAASLEKARATKEARAEIIRAKVEARRAAKAEARQAAREMKKSERLYNDLSMLSEDEKRILILHRMVWNAMKFRCYNLKCKQYHDYGGRGITVSDEWLDSFDTFLSDMGFRPEGYTLERIDNDKGYSKDNCKWASRNEQQLNTRRSIMTANMSKHERWNMNYFLKT